MATSPRGRRGVCALSLTCGDNWPGLITAAKARYGCRHAGLTSVLRSESRLHRGQRWSKHWQCLLPQHGPGRKHHRPIELADWQQVVVAAHPGDFARGLFHSDGCRVVNRVRRSFRSGSAGMSIRVTSSPMSQRTSSACAGRFLTNWGSAGDSRGTTLSRWLGGRRWRGSMSSSGQSTDSNARARLLRRLAEQICRPLPPPRACHVNLVGTPLEGHRDRRHRWTRVPLSRCSTRCGGSSGSG